MSRFNAVRHSVLSQFTVLPWESETEYRALLNALMAEHRPIGAIEASLVEEIASAVWRKRRLRLAEAAMCHQAMIARIGDAKSVKMADESPADLKADKGMTRRALGLLRAGGPDGYRKALAALREDTRQWWHKALSERREGGEPYTADAASLRRFLETEILPRYSEHKERLASLQLICGQALVEALDRGQIERVARYEAHLSRQLERSLAMLVRLKELRRGTVEG